MELVSVLCMGEKVTLIGLMRRNRSSYTWMDAEI